MEDVKKYKGDYFQGDSFDTRKSVLIDAIMFDVIDKDLLKITIYDNKAEIKAESTISISSLENTLKLAKRKAEKLFGKVETKTEIINASARRIRTKKKKK